MILRFIYISSCISTFLLLSNILFSGYTVFFFFKHWWAFGLFLLFGCSELCCYEHLCISFYVPEQVFFLLGCALFLKRFAFSNFSVKVFTLLIRYIFKIKCKVNIANVSRVEHTFLRDTFVLRNTVWERFLSDHALQYNGMWGQERQEPRISE